MSKEKRDLIGAIALIIAAILIIVGFNYDPKAERNYEKENAAIMQEIQKELRGFENDLRRYNK